jgi:hypothetical protein
MDARRQVVRRWPRRKGCAKRVDCIRICSNSAAENTGVVSFLLCGGCGLFAAAQLEDSSQVIDPSVILRDRYFDG